MVVPEGRRGKAWTTCCCLAWLAGCGAPIGLTSLNLRPDAVSQIASRRLASLRDFRGDASVTLQSPDGTRERALVAVAFRPPDRLRVEAVTFIGISLMTVLARGDSLLVYVPSENRLLEGSPASDLLRGVAGLDLETVPPAAFFLGIPIISPDCIGRVDTLSSGGASIVFRCKKQSGVRETLIDPRLAVVTEERLYDYGGRLMMRRVLRGYHRTDSFPVPTEIEVTRGSRGAPIGAAEIGNETLHLRYTSLRINRGIHEDVFKLSLPKGVLRSSM